MLLNEDKVIHKIVLATGVNPAQVSVPTRVRAKDGRTFAIRITDDDAAIYSMDELRRLERELPFITNMHLSAISNYGDGAAIHVDLICDAELIPQAFMGDK